MSKKNQHLYEFLLTHSAQEPVRFHMPGHMSGGVYSSIRDSAFLSHASKLDITEIPGADDLFDANGVLRDLAERYQKMYHSDYAYPMVNGSTGGLISAILASVPMKGHVLIARNCHKSVMNGLMLREVTASFVYPEAIEPLGISGSILPFDVEKALGDDPEICAVIVTSPNYYGVQSDIGEIAEIAHRHDAVLIVDQAHGAHLPHFRDYQKSGGNVPFRCIPAEEVGADLVISSLHKTMASFGQTALLTLNGSRVDPLSVEQALETMETSSPSYLLMASMDANAQLMETEGRERIENWLSCIGRFYEEAEKIPGLKVLCHPMMDQTKLVMNFSEAGLNAIAFQDELMKRNVWPEFAVADEVMCLTGIGTGIDDIEALLSALWDISEKCKENGRFSGEAVPRKGSSGELNFAPVKNVCRDHDEIAYKKVHVAQRVELSANVFCQMREKVTIEEAVGRRCAVAVTPYPPGIPTIFPDEIITREAVNFLTNAADRGECVHGMDDCRRICVFL